MQKTNNIKSLKIFTALIISLLAVILIWSVNEIQAQAKTIVIKTGDQLRDINWKNKGYGPGNKYVIGNDLTLGDGEYATCRLTKGKFVIDFNGHTVQNARNNLGVFSISGANVVFVDSKVKSNKASVRSYGVGAIDMTAGRLEIRNGNYVGLSNGTNSPSGLHVGGGTCIVNGGFIGGDYMGADCSGGNLYINGGTFEGGFTFALADLGEGNIKISKGTFKSGTTNYGYQFAFGAYAPNQYYDFSKWIASGAKLTPSFQNAYWNMQSQISAYPSSLYYFAVSYNSPQLKVTNSVKSNPAALKKVVSKKKKTLTASWGKAKGVSGYKVQIATNKGFTKNAKTVSVSNKKSAVTFKKLKSKKKYYVRIRTYKKYNGKVLYSKWSKLKTVKVK